MTTSGYPSVNMASNFVGCCYCWLDLHRYGVVSINDDNICIDDGCSREYMIIHWTSIIQWLHSPFYWNTWVFAFSFWFIFYHICTYHYCASLAIFFSPFDACFLLSTMHVHSFEMAIIIFQQAITLGWGSSCFPHIIVSAPSSLVDLCANNNSFISCFLCYLDHHFMAMGPICIQFLPFFFVDCFLLFLLWVVSTCAFICLVLLMDGFRSLILKINKFIHDFFSSLFFLAHLSHLLPGALFNRACQCFIADR